MEITEGGDLEKLREILKNPTLIETADINAFPILHCASLYAQDDTLILSPDKDEKWTTPSRIVQTSGEYMELVRLLIAMGADVSGEGGEEALIAAGYNGDVETAEILLAKGVTKGREKALLMAAFEGHIEVGRVLLEDGTDPNRASAYDIRYGTRYMGNESKPLIAASSEGHTEFAEMLLDYEANVNLPNYDGSTAVSSAEENGYTETVALLKSRGAK